MTRDGIIWLPLAQTHTGLSMEFGGVSWRRIDDNGYCADGTLPATPVLDTIRQQCSPKCQIMTSAMIPTWSGVPSAAFARPATSCCRSRHYLAPEVHAYLSEQPVVNWLPVRPPKITPPCAGSAGSIFNAFSRNPQPAAIAAPVTGTLDGNAGTARGNRHAGDPDQNGGIEFAGNTRWRRALIRHCIACRRSTWHTSLQFIQNVLAH